MSTYRAVVRHVRYWRGSIHHWSTSYPYEGSPTKPIDSGLCQEILQADDAMLFPGGAASLGGTYECSFYKVGGGAALATYSRFDPATPAAWIKPSGTYWTTKAGILEPQAEVALQVEWPAGISKTGKPVRFRKWFHHVLQSGGEGTSPDVAAADIASLEAGANLLTIAGTADYGVYMGSGGRLPASPVVSAFYGNHQMPRGRRQKIRVTNGVAYRGKTVTATPIPPVEED